MQNDGRHSWLKSFFFAKFYAFLSLPHSVGERVGVGGVNCSNDFYILKQMHTVVDT